MGFAKILLYIFNSIFLICGGVCLGVGIWVQVDSSSLITVTRLATSATSASSLNVPSLIEGASIGLMIGGGLVFFIAFLGCCGACKEVKACLYAYALLIIVIVIAEITSVILAAVYFNQFETYAQTFLTTALTGNYIGPYDTSNAVSLAFDGIFISLSCCGVANYTDFAGFTTWNTTYVNTDTMVTSTAVMPLTCCQFSNTAAFPTDMTTFIASMTDKACPVTKASSNANTGCYAATKTAITEYTSVSIGVGAGILALELLGIICACVVIRDINKQNSIGSA